MLVLAASLTIGSSPAAASCAPLSSIRDDADRADAVVYGRVTGFEGPPGRPSRFMFVRVERVLKGAAYETIGVGLGPESAGGGGPAATSVDYQAGNGTDHVLYLKQRAPGGYTTDACSGSHPGPLTGEEHALFGDGRTPDRTPQGIGDVRGGDRTTAALATLAAFAAAVGATFFAFSRTVDRGTRTDRPGVWLALASGIGGGVAIALVTSAAERSRIAFGPFALYGNGALGVPAFLVPVALFIGWAGLLRGRGRAPVVPMLLFALGLAVGSGAWGILDQGLPGIVGGIFTGLLFVIPTALLAVATIALFRSRRIPTNPVAVSAALVLGTLVLLIPPVSYLGGFGVGGIASGAATVAASRGGSIPAAFALGLALLALMLAQAFALPILGQIMAS